jgi:predicted enzyme related to lactoylglutathione lyase
MPARLIEIELRVADVERSRRFYRDLIGVSVGELETHGGDTEPHAHATWGEWSGAEPSLLMLNIYPSRNAGATTSRLGFVIEDLDAVDERLREAGTAVVQAPQDLPWGRTATYRDPDGNSVSLTQSPR